MASSSGQYYTPAKTTDDDDEEEEHLTSSGRRPPPPTQYRDDPSNSYRDNPTSSTNKSSNDEENVPSIFDWGAPSSTSTAAATETVGSGGKSKKKKNNNHKGTAFQIDDPTTFDPDVEIPFTPISLHDDDDSESDVSGAEQLRPHVNGLFKSTINRRSGGKRSHNGNLYGQIDNGGEDDEHQQQEGRLFVGGGWGRHGSTTDYRCGKLLTNCCSCERRYCCGRNPYGGNNFLCSSTGCFVVVFVMMTFLCGYLGYEAGLPVVTTTLDTANTTTTTNNNDGDDGFETTEHSSHTSVTTHGDLWLEWIKKEKDEIHLPHFHLNFTKRHAPIIYTDDNNNKQLSFPPMSQSELLTQSQHVFQSCSERSIATAAGRDACLSLCHGHYCCFEKDVEFGSCVTTANSYCFVYAACENVIMDFGFTNVENIEGIKKRPSNGGGSVDVDGLNRQDIDLLTATCSKDNVATLEGIRDCSAFCQHHLCCFSKDEGENCAEDHVEECEAYEPCRIIAEGPDGNNKGGVGGGSGITVTPEQVEKSVFDACYFGDDESKVTQGLVEKCHNICASRYCCFDSQTIVSSCRDTVGEEECNLYSLCEQMINDRGDEVKNFIELDKKEFTFGSSSSASNNNVNNAGMSSSGGTSYRPGSGGTFIDEAEFEETLSEVTAACDSNQPDDSWVSRCHALCADYLCCFSTDGTESNCKDVHGDDVCEAYSGCQVLQKLPSSSSTAESSPSSSSQQQQPQQQTNDQIAEQVQIDEMTETCVPKIRRDAGLRERCRKVCEPRDCCWKNGVGNCYQMNTDWCEEFSLCEILVV